MPQLSAKKRDNPTPPIYQHPSKDFAPSQLMMSKIIKYNTMASEHKSVLIWKDIKTKHKW